MPSKALNRLLQSAQNVPLSTTLAGVLVVALSTYYLLRSRRSQRTSQIPHDRERVLILGATSGVGRTLAHKYASRGTFVCVVGRRQAMLDEVVQECKELSERAGFTDRVLGVSGNFAETQDMVHLRQTIHNGAQSFDNAIMQDIHACL